MADEDEVSELERLSELLRRAQERETDTLQALNESET